MVRSGGGSSGPSDQPGAGSTAVGRPRDDPAAARGGLVGLIRLSQAPLAAGLVIWTVFVVRNVDLSGPTPGYTLFDDAMISMRYGKNLADGLGLVWDPSQPATSGFTNPLWTLWMALLHRVGLRGAGAATAVALTGIVLLAALVVLSVRLSLVVAPGATRSARLSGWFVVVSFPLAYWTLRGMEVGLLAVLLVGAAVLLLSAPTSPRPGRCLVGLASVCFVAALTRPDAFVPLLAMAVTADLLAPRWRRGVRTSVAAIGVIGGAVVVSGVQLVLYGSAVPNTYVLKVGGTTLADRLPRGALTASLTIGTLLVPVVLAGVAVVRARGRQRPAVGALAAAVIAVVAYSAYVGGDAWEWMNLANRYVAPTLPLLGVAAATGLVLLLEAGPGLTRRTLWATSAVAAAGAIWLATGLVPTSQLVATDQVDSIRATTLALTAVVVGIAAWKVGSPILVRLLLSAVVIGLFLWPFANWLQQGAVHADDDNDHARFGVELGRVLPLDAVIAVRAAGALPYFADQPAVDELGKTDPRIAAEAPKGRPFYPGHNKWDDGITIAEERPAVIVDVPEWDPSTASIERVERYGYVRVGGGATSHLVFVDPAQVDPETVSRAITASGFR